MLRGEEEWRPDRISVPETREIRRGGWEGPSGKSERGAEVITRPTRAGSLLSSQAKTAPPKPAPGHLGPGSIEGRPGRSGEAGERGPLAGAGEKWRTIAPPTPARELDELPGWPPAFQEPSSPPAWVLGGIGGRLGRPGEAGGRGPPGGEGKEWRAFAPPTQARAQGAC